MPKVVSLIASATEIVCALGFERDLVGRSHECDYPPTVRGLPVLTAPKLRTDAGSREIDRQVKALVRDGLAVYRVDAALLRELAPDVIVTQDQCEVCAVSLADVEAAVECWLDRRPAVVSCRPDSLADVWADIRRIAQSLGAASRGEELVARIEGRIARLSERRAGAARPRVACIEWVDPLMAAGNWVPELVELAGGVNLFGAPGRHSPWLEWEALVAAEPEVVVVMPCGYDIPRASADLEILAARPEWSRLPAVRDGRVYVVDGNQYFNRPGPRLVDSLEILTEILHPGAGEAVHEGTAWVRYPTG